jgi:two-component sensor histidine kinase
MDRLDQSFEAERVLNSVSDNFYEIAPDWTIRFINRAGLEYFDLDRSAVLGRMLWEVLPATEGTQVGHILRTAMESQTAVRAEMWGATHPDRWIDISAFPMDGGGIAVIWRDETERKHYDDAVQQTLRRQEGLYRELNHRIANSLQSVVGIVRLATRSIGDLQSKAIVTNAVDHIIALSLVHRRLYQSHGVERQEVKEYLEALCRELAKAFHSETAMCGISCDVEEGVYTVTDTTLTLGLILSELVMNSLKHSQCANLAVALRAQDGEIKLQVADDGVGIPEDFAPSKTRGIGLRLVQAWAKSLDGRCEFGRASPHGTTATLFFPAEGHVAYDPAP